MLASEFNSTIAKRPINVPPDAHISIIKHLDNEVLIEVEGKKAWVEKRIKKLYIPLNRKTDFRPKSNFNPEYANLSGGAYKLLMWILSLEEYKFSSQYASECINISSKTIRTLIKELVIKKKIKVDTVGSLGYGIEIVQ